MANIDLSRFVDIKIQYHQKAAISSLRDTVVLLTTETLATDVDNNTFNSLAEWMSFVEDNGLDVSSSGGAYHTDAYLRVFFANNGAKVRVLSQVTDSKEAIKAIIAQLPDEQIVIASTGSETILREVAQDLSASEKPLKYKLLLSRLTYTSESIPEAITGIQRYFCKLSNKLGAEMTLAAYLTTIDVYAGNTVQDYAFTQEYGYKDYQGNEISITEPQDDNVLGACLNNNFNIIMNLAGTDRNLGGNLADGKDIVNEFILIVLQQTLTNRLVNLLPQHLKNSSGLSSIYSVIDQELAKYLKNGYLTTDKVWTDEDMIVTYNDQNYTIINKGDALLLGYRVKILPFNSISDADKQERKTPPIYIILADSYGIRKIVIRGEVI